MILYHFPSSPFARRVRLALALKGLHAELRDARNDPEHAAALRELSPFHTVPVLVSDDGVWLDSAAICQYLERKRPTPPLWPHDSAGAAAFQLCALADGVITPLIDLGLRYAPLDDHPRFAEVQAAQLGRAQRGLDRLAELVAAQPSGPLCGTAWGAADIALFTMVVWLETMPQRASTFAPARKMLDLGWKLPAALRSWADPHRTRADVLSLDGAAR